jgi:hypothetical protein
MRLFKVQNASASKRGSEPLLGASEKASQKPEAESKPCSICIDPDTLHRATTAYVCTAHT